MGNESHRLDTTKRALLILDAFLLILRLELAAEQLANTAYFSLLVGVGIKFVNLVREKGYR